MMGRLIGGAAALTVHFLAATLIAALLMGTYVWIRWEMNGAKLAHIVGVAQGHIPLTEEGEDESDGVPPEEASRDVIVDRRATSDRNQELREMENQQAAGAVRIAQREINQKLQELDRLRKQVATDLAVQKEQILGVGIADVRNILTNLQSKQAKTLILEMLDDDKLDVAVAVLNGMDSRTKAKILSEFKDDAENKQVYEMIERIRQGGPEAEIVEQAMRDLGAGNVTQ